MNLINTARSLVEGQLQAGKAKVASMQQGRDKTRLLTELGEARYAQSKGVTTSEAEMDRLIAELDALEVSEADENEPDAAEASTEAETA